MGDRIRKLVLTEEEALEIAVPESLEGSKPRRFLVVGRLLTAKTYNKDSLMGTMKSLWTSRKSLSEKTRIWACALEGSDRVLFSFQFEADRRRMLAGCPWHFDKALLALSATGGRVDPQLINLSVQFFWIRVRSIPPLFLEDNVGEVIGNTIYRYLWQDG